MFFVYFYEHRLSVLGAEIVFLIMGGLHFERVRLHQVNRRLFIKDLRHRWYTRAVKMRFTDKVSFPLATALGQLQSKRSAACMLEQLESLTEQAWSRLYSKKQAAQKN